MVVPNFKCGCQMNQHYFYQYSESYQIVTNYSRWLIIKFCSISKVTCIIFLCSVTTLMSEVVETLHIIEHYVNKRPFEINWIEIREFLHLWVDKHTAFAEKVSSHVLECKSLNLDEYVQFVICTVLLMRLHLCYCWECSTFILVS